MRLGMSLSLGVVSKGGGAPTLTEVNFGYAGQSLAVRNFKKYVDTTTLAALGLTVPSQQDMFVDADGGAGVVPSGWQQSSDAGPWDGAGAVEFSRAMVNQLPSLTKVRLIGKMQGNTNLAAWQPGQQLHTDLLATLAAANKPITAFLLGIGHNDAQFSGTSYDTFYSQLTAFWASIDTALGGANAYKKIVFGIPNITNNAYNTSLSSRMQINGCHEDWCRANNATFLAYADIKMVADGIHPDQIGSMRQERHHYRASRALVGLSGDDRGPLITGISKSGVNVTAPVNHQTGATSLVSQGSPATRFLIGRRGTGTALTLDGTTPLIVNTADLAFKLASDPGNVPLELFPLAVHPVNDGSADMILDNHTDGDGISHGRSLYASPYGFDTRPAANLTVTSPTYSSTMFGGGLSAGYAESPFPISPFRGVGMTIECFYKHLTTVAAHRTIFAQLNNWWLTVNNANLVLTNTTITTGFTVGQTYHIALVFLPGVNKTLIFINGTLTGTVASSLLTDATTNFTIRRFGPGNSSFDMGTAGEVAHVAAFRGVRYLTNFTPPATQYTGNEPNMLHLWKLQGNGNDSII